MGYDRIREFTKFREEWIFNVDKLNFGRFIEIEGPKKEIERMVDDLGFQDRERFAKAYLSLEDDFKSRNKNKKIKKSLWWRFLFFCLFIYILLFVYFDPTLKQ